jgi:arylmalonate decarboxylase
MKRGYSPYGWRGRIGLVLPSVNVVTEHELNHFFLPGGISVHTARVMTRGTVTEASFKEMADDVERAARLLETADVDAVAYACTSGSIVEDQTPIIRRIREITGVPAVATAGAVVAALKSLGASAVAVATPYVEFVDEAERRFLEHEGFKVTTIRGLRLGGTEETRRAIGKQPPEVAYRLACETDSAAADCMFISCTNLATASIIAPLEAQLRKPVVTSVQATAWALLGLLGINDRIEGYGTLLSSDRRVAPGRSD